MYDALFKRSVDVFPDSSQQSFGRIVAGSEFVYIIDPAKHYKVLLYFRIQISLRSLLLGTDL